MKARHYNLKKLVVLGSASVFTMLAVPLISDIAFDHSTVLVSAAQAADDHATGGSGGKGGKGGSATGGQKNGSGGSHESATGGASKSVEAVVGEEEEGGKGKMGSGVHGQGSYQDSKQKGGGSAPGPGGTNDEPNDAKGPRYAGGAGTGSQGGKPVWAQEGLPKNADGSEVELGRLNVARAPGKLLDKQLIEALSSLAVIVAESGSSIYTVGSLDAAIALIKQDAARVDSPLANLALLKDFLTDGVLDGNYVKTDGTTNEVLNPTMSDADFVSILLGSAADKTVTITAGTVGAMETILGLDLGDDATIAASADAVRSAILEAHDD
jgi:hypothetical protein